MLFRHTRVINRQTDSKRVLDRHAARQTRHTNKNARQTDILKRGLDRQTDRQWNSQTDRHKDTYIQTWTDILTRVLDTHIRVPYINSGRHIKRYRDRHRQTGTET